jgi:hypothetical protein
MGQRKQSVQQKAEMGTRKAKKLEESVVKQNEKSKSKHQCLQ